jgi:3'-5' exoribonuclease
MSTKAPSPATLRDLTDGQEADLFLLLTQKEELVTKNGKPYYRVAFRDATREVSFPVWSDSPWAEDCRRQWNPGTAYKLRAIYRESQYGPQLEIKKIRPTAPADERDGFDPAALVPRSRRDPDSMFRELADLVQTEIGNQALADLVVDILESNRDGLLRLPAAVHHHHAYEGGFLEHVLSVVHNARLLADKYTRQYADMQPPLSRDVVLAGAVLHDIGKLVELEVRDTGTVYSPAGEMIGHVVLGRDLVREAASRHAVDRDTLLRLEHIVVSHQRLPEWGSPKPPMTPEAMIVHFADDLDARMQMIYAALADESGDEPLTTKKNPLKHKLFRGLPS